MDHKNRCHFPYELKKEIIQKVKDGIKRSYNQKEYGIASDILSKWVCSPDKIISKANGEILPVPDENKDDDNNADDDSIAEIGNDNGDDDDSDVETGNDNGDVDDDVDDDNADDGDDDNKLEADDNNTDDDDDDAEDLNRLVNKYKVLSKTNFLSEENWGRVMNESKVLRKKGN